MLQNLQILKKVTPFLQVVLLFVFPIIFLLSANIPDFAKGIIIIVLILIIILISIRDKMSAKELGFRVDNLKQSLVPYSALTFIGLVTLILVSHLLHKEHILQWWANSHLPWTLLISFIQEFAYRSFVQTKLQKIMKPVWAILIAAVLYSGMHILWKDPSILILTFAGGIGWGYLWYKYPNLYLLTLSHAILNFLIIYLGFFPWLITQFFSPQ